MFSKVQRLKRKKENVRQRNIVRRADSGQNVCRNGKKNVCFFSLLFFTVNSIFLARGLGYKNRTELVLKLVL